MESSTSARGAASGGAGGRRGSAGGTGVSFRGTGARSGLGMAGPSGAFSRRNSRPNFIGAAYRRSATGRLLHHEGVRLEHVVVEAGQELLGAGDLLAVAAVGGRLGDVDHTRGGPAAGLRLGAR